jgi:hypothetical protein
MLDFWCTHRARAKHRGGRVKTLCLLITFWARRYDPSAWARGEKIRARRVI